MANVVDLNYGPDGLLYQTVLDTGFQLNTGQQFGIPGSPTDARAGEAAVLAAGGHTSGGHTGGGGGSSSSPAGPTTVQIPQSGAAGPFAGQGVFTAWDPSAALNAPNPPSWVAIMPDKATPELVAALRAKGIRIVIWEATASQAGADAVRQYNADGYIAQAENQAELDAANTIAAQIQVPKALVSNNFMPAYPPGWIAMPEAYTNNNPAATADQVTRDAQNRGATVVVPILGLFNPDAPGGTKMTYADYQKALALAVQGGAAGVGAYLAEQMYAPGSDIGGGYTGTGGEIPAGGPTGTPGNPAGGGGQPGLPGTGGSGSVIDTSTIPGGPTNGTLDWSQYFSDWGLPPDVVAQLNQILKNISDPQQAVAMGIAFLRGTDWYKQTYPGISAGFANGLVANEAQYRQLLNQQNQLYVQWTGQPISKGTFATNLGLGLSNDVIDKRLQGAAYAGTYYNDLKFVTGGYGDAPVSFDQAIALGEQQAGLGSPIGMKVQKAVEEATRRLQGLFQGSLASPAGLGLGGAGLQGAGIQGVNQSPDVGK